MRHAELGTFVRQTRILHEDALKDFEHTVKYYSTFDRMENYGGKAPMSPKFMDFVVKLAVLCDEELAASKVVERGKACLKEGIYDVVENEKLRCDFMQCVGELPTNLKLGVN